MWWGLWARALLHEDARRRSCSRNRLKVVTRSSPSPVPCGADIGVVQGAVPDESGRGAQQGARGGDGEERAGDEDATVLYVAGLAQRCLRDRCTAQGGADDCTKTSQDDMNKSGMPGRSI